VTTPERPLGSAAPELCPTHAVCPPCREGWGHWDGHRYVPTIQSVAVRIASAQPVYVSHECYGNRHDDCAWPRCECGCHRDQ